jgi:dihydroflavonol-4-reductase
MASDPSSTRVLVTGASGFIALHTVLRLLQLGYPVRATVRTEAQEKQVRETLSRHVDTSQLEFVCADLLKDEGWNDAIQGCHLVLHLASPFPTDAPKDENEVIAPARDGTLRVLRAAGAGRVKRVVLVSSAAAVLGGHEKENRTFTEADWTDVSKIDYAYAKSKTLAERAAWDFIRGAENKSGLELVSVNPANVFGPVLDSHHHTSTEWFRTLLRREIPGIPRAQLNVVDVRDVAEMIVRAMTAPGAVDKRFIASGASIEIEEFANILQRHFASRGYRVPTRVLPDWLVRLVGIFTPKTKPVVQALGWTYSLSTEQAKSILGWQARPYEETIVEMAESLIEHGLV